MKRVVFFVSCVVVSTAVFAAEFSLGLLGGNTSGDTGRRDDLAGFRQGLELSFRQGSGLDTLSLRFLPTGEGRLAYSAAWGDRWRLHAEFVRSRRFSDTSTYPERTPLGTPVSAFYPGSNALAPAFGGLEPVASRNHLRVVASYGTPWQGVSVWFAGFTQQGSRTAQVGGLTFGDLGAPAFFPASLAQLDSTHWEVGLRGARRLEAWWLAAEAAAGENQGEKTSLLPTFGRTAVLDVAAFRQASEGHFARGGAAVGYRGHGLELLASATYARTSSTPRFFTALRPAPLVSQLRAAGGELTVQAGSGSVTLQPVAWLSLRLTGKLRREERQASAEEAFFAPASARAWDLLREDGGELEVSARGSWLRFRLRAGASSGGNEVRQTHGASLTSYQADISRRWLTSRLSLRLPEGWKLELSGQAQRRERTLDLQELLFGYVVGDGERRWMQARFELRKSWGGWDFSLSGGQSNAKDDWQAPFYDPIYDPSWQLSPVTARVKGRDTTLQLAYAAGERWSGYLETAYRWEKWQMDAPIFPGFWWVEEEVRGLSLGLGGSWQVSERSQLSFSGSWDAPSRTVSHRWYWADASYLHDLRRGLALFVRAFARRFDESRFQLDDFTLKGLSVGLKGSL